MTQSQCPRETELIRFVDADLSPERSDRVRKHLGQCATCTRQVQEVRSLVEAIGATPEIEFDVRGHVMDVMAGLDRRVAPGNRPRPLAKVAAITAIAASVGLVVHVVGLRHGSPPGTWQARGSSQGESLSRDVGVQVYALAKALQPVHPGDTIAPSTALTAGLRNLGHARAYVLIFAVDARNQVHWITPKYTRADEDPTATESLRTEEERLLPSSVVFDDLAEGPLRIVTIVSPAPVRVSQVESLAQTELSQGHLARRFASAEVREIVVYVSHAYQGKAL